MSRRNANGMKPMFYCPAEVHPDATGLSLKKTYESKAEAIAVIGKARAKPYKCRICRKWHITSK